VAAGVFVVSLSYFRSGTFDEESLALLYGVGAATASGALICAVAGAVGSRLGLWRSLGVPMRDRFSWSTTVASGAVLLLAVLLQPWDLPDVALFAAAGTGVLAGTLVQFLLHVSSPTYYYALALLRQRRGNRDGACEAIGSYLLICHKDPDSATRRPIAERFLRDAGTSLQVPTELFAAEAPAGRGTEPEHAPAPPGRGTEPEREPRPPELAREGDTHR